MRLKLMTVKMYNAESKRARPVLRFKALLAIAILCAATVGTAHAVGFDNSLWLGNDTNSFQGALNTDTSGTVLRTLPDIPATGFAVDIGTGSLYISEGSNFLSERDLGTLVDRRTVMVAGVRFFEDMTFDGSNIWASDFYSITDLFQGVILKIDPTTLTVVSSFVPTGIVHPIGLAWDGSGLWVSGCTAEADCGAPAGAYIVKRFDTAGNPTGQSFTPSGLIGGLGFDPRSQTLWVGGVGLVREFTTSGTLVSSFTVESGRFVDGLEFQGAESPPPEVAVVIDIKPGPGPNCIKKTNRGVVPVAILGGPDLDVSVIDLSSLQIDDDDDPTTAGVAPSHIAYQDVNLDSQLDIIMQFSSVAMNSAGLFQDGADLFVTGTLTDDTPILGSDIIYLAGGPHCP